MTDETSLISRIRALLDDLAMRNSLDRPFIFLLVCAELLLSFAIVHYVPYTEIDWEAYMQEVEFVIEGERDYTKIYGGTGPLVYPAGFVYLFIALRWMTNEGTDIRQAQYIFIIFYVCNQTLLLTIYHQILPFIRKTEKPWDVWAWRVAMGSLCLSKRIHSIFLLRLFNDGPTMLLLYVAIYLFTLQRWNLGCFAFSLAVSLKMNVLLFAPGLLLLLLQVGPDLKTVILRLGLGCALPQLLLGAPFLATFPVSYLRKAFELDRVFFYKWTVNFKFINESLFLSKPWALGLLICHLVTLAVLARKWCLAAKKATGRCLFIGRPLSPQYVAYTLLLTNFVGIVFARTLHYQFYSWYFHSIPYLLWTTNVYPLPVKLLVLASMEYAFLTFPATQASSTILQVAHFATLIPCLLKDPPSIFPLERKQKLK